MKRKCLEYTLENDNGEKYEFNRIVDIARFIGCVPSTIIVHLNSDCKYKGWNITKTEDPDCTKHKKAKKLNSTSYTKNPTKYYKSESGWVYHKYIKDEDVICCEKSYHFNSIITFKDFPEIEEIVVNSLKILLKDIKLYKRYIINIDAPKYTNIKSVKQRNFLVQVFVRFLDKDRFINEIYYMEDKFKLIDKVLKEYETRKRGGY